MAKKQTEKQTIVDIFAKPDSIDAFFRLTRIEHGLMLVLAVAIAEIIILKTPNFLSLPLFLSLLVPLFNEMASFSLNDLLDIKADKINKRNDRPLVTGEISKKIAIATTMLGYSLSLVFAFFINPICLAIAMFFAAFSIAYNYMLKKLPFVGNIYIAISMAIPFVFGNFAVSTEANPAVLSLSLLAFLAGLAREIIKSAEDLEGDKKARNAFTLPAVIGVKHSVYGAVFIYFLFAISAFLPFYFGLNQNPYLPVAYLPLILVAISVFSILYICIRLLKSQKKETLQMARKLSLPALFVGMMGILLAAIA